MSPQRPDTALYFNEVVSLGRNRAYLAGHFYKHEGTDIELTRIRKYEDGKWGSLGDVQGIARALSVTETPNRRLTVLCSRGQVWERSASGIHEDQIPIRGHGQLFGMRQIGGTLYACGVHEQVFRHDGHSWVSHDQGVYTPMKQAPDRMFFAIDGTSSQDIYCVGMGGVIAHYDGTRWTYLDSPTNYDLNMVLCRSPGEVYVAGNQGGFFHGHQPGRWNFAGVQGSEEIFTGMAWFQGLIYLCSQRKLYTFDGNTLRETSPAIGDNVMFYRLSATETDLWATSAREEIYHFDGKDWERLISPDSQPHTP